MEEAAEVVGLALASLHPGWGLTATLYSSLERAEEKATVEDRRVPSIAAARRTRPGGSVRAPAGRARASDEVRGRCAAQVRREGPQGRSSSGPSRGTRAASRGSRGSGSEGRGAGRGQREKPPAFRAPGS